MVITVEEINAINTTPSGPKTDRQREILRQLGDLKGEARAQGRLTYVKYIDNRVRKMSSAFAPPPATKLVGSNNTKLQSADRSRSGGGMH